MSEEKATPSSGSTAGSASTRKSGLSSRRRSATPKPGTATGGPALAPERDDSFQRFPRIWPD
ncbi:hypothetical protein CKO31_19965 [Thiohalocapsa halophila]|uniref:Uncharacterized protein n=1 Tax=Thiohalocapsa halophila TaxID=69359 RepID=A0ABS1CM45_9GAMM|nr:hypothetical protein [Thiohalocapsa halophila]MBK1632986.1 hypothetical protein [Thiohalocapsa halophila]